MLRSARLSFPLLLLCLLLPACDSNDNGNNNRGQTAFEVYDTSGNGMIEFDEFFPLLRSRGFNGSNTSFFSYFDADQSGDFSEEEFNALALFYFDPDENGIDENEFEDGADLFFGNQNDQTFSDYDEDASEIIEEGEFTNSFAERGLFDELDTSGDGMALSSSELARGFFNLADRDDDAGLDEDEFYEGVNTILGVDLSPQQSGTASLGATL